MKTIFTEVRRWLSEPVLTPTGAEPRLSPRDWADMPVFHPNAARPAPGDDVSGTRGHSGRGARS